MSICLHVRARVCGLSILTYASFFFFIGPLPTLLGHTLTGLSGKKAMVLGGLAVGRRNSGSVENLLTAIPGGQNIHPSLVIPDSAPRKTSLGSGWVLTVGGRRKSGSGINLRRNSKPSEDADGNHWQNRDLLGRPPIRRAFHTAHRVVVGGVERIVVYGGELGSMASRPTSPHPNTPNKNATGVDGVNGERKSARGGR